MCVFFTLVGSGGGKKFLIFLANFPDNLKNKYFTPGVRLLAKQFILILFFKPHKYKGFSGVQVYFAQCLVTS